MIINNIIFSPVGIFLIFLLLVGVIYWWSGRIAPKADPEGGKTNMYACGEALPEIKHSSSAAMFFHAALYFTIIDVAALTIATIPPGAGLLLGIFYITGISLAVLALVLR
jgi:NADH:ubiquinone oxidoreductase subunit 3 (subunit A)